MRYANKLLQTLIFNTYSWFRCILHCGRLVETLDFEGSGQRGIRVPSGPYWRLIRNGVKMRSEMVVHTRGCVVVLHLFRALPVGIAQRNRASAKPNLSEKTFATELHRKRHESLALL